MKSKTETIAFGGGCFWCTEAVFELLKGVLKTTAGYAGGEKEDPGYEDVVSGGTGHVEVVEVEYNPDAIPFEKLLEVFFRMHNPTSMNKQGIADYGSEYMSAIFYTTQGQKETITRFMKDEQKNYSKPIVTQARRLGKFYTAEDYHQKFYDKNPFNPYCIFVTGPEVAKIKREFKEYLR